MKTLILAQIRTSLENYIDLYNIFSLPHINYFIDNAIFGIQTKFLSQHKMIYNLSIGMQRMLK